MPYITQPPKPNRVDIPKFIEKFYGTKPIITLQYILDLISWSEKEFLDIRSKFIVDRDLDGIRKIRNKDCLWLLAYTKEFDMIVNNMTQEIWSSIPKSVRDTLVKTKEIYDRIQ